MADAATPEAQTKLWSDFADSVSPGMVANASREAPYATVFLANIVKQQIQASAFLKACQVTAPEHRRSQNWMLQEYEPVANFIVSLVKKESPQTWKSLVAHWKTQRKAVNK